MRKSYTKHMFEYARQEVGADTCAVADMVIDAFEGLNGFDIRARLKVINAIKTNEKQIALAEKIKTACEGKCSPEERKAFEAALAEVETRKAKPHHERGPQVDLTAHGHAWQAHRMKLKIERFKNPQLTKTDCNVCSVLKQYVPAGEKRKAFCEAAHALTCDQLADVCEMIQFECLFKYREDIVKPASATVIKAPHVVSELIATDPKIRRPVANPQGT